MKSNRKFGTTISRAAALTLLGLASASAQAANISLVATSTTNINIGDEVTFNMWIDASDVGGILAGGLDLFYILPVLTYNDDFAFDASFPTDPDFTRTGDDCTTSSNAGCTFTGEINGIAFGNFGGLAATENTLVGSLSFTGAAVGISDLTMADNDTPAGKWFATDGTPLDMVYNTLSVDVSEVAEVPLPAAGWLMLSGLGLLGGIARRKAKNA